MKRKIAAAVTGAVLFGGVGLVDVANAAKPANQACTASYFDYRRGGIGGFVRDLPHQVISWGDIVQAVQAGLIPDDAGPDGTNTCND